MKKTFFIFYLVLIFLVLLFVLCGCNNTKVNNSTNLELTPEDDLFVNNTDSQLEETSEDVKIEETSEKFSVTKTIWLKENPTTGYRWSYKIEDESVAVVEGDEYTTTNTNEGIAGASGVHAFRLSGLKEGQTTITFNYSRSWESVQPLKTEVFSITVNSDSLITIEK